MNKVAANAFPPLRESRCRLFAGSRVVPRCFRPVPINGRGFLIFAGGVFSGLRPRHPYGNVRGFAPDTPTAMSGALPPTPPPAFEKAGPKLFYGKVLRCEQRAVNTEYSVFARPARRLCSGIFSAYGRCFAEAFSIRLAFAKQKLSS